METKADTWEKEFDKFAVYMIETYKYSLGEGNEIMNEIHDFIQKTKHSLLTTSKADWLRSEIEKLEIRVEETKKYWNEKAPHNCGLCWEEDYCNHEIARNVLTSIITRYKEELKVLESK